MIIDMDEHVSEDKLVFDICIIGSGAAGLTIAREFLGGLHRVVVLEGGGQRFEVPSQEPYRSQIVGLPCEGVHQGRARVLGGTTTLWAGQALPYLPIDFQEREWVPFSGWPIGRQELSPFYRRAEDLMQIPHATYDAQTWPHRKAPPSYDAARIVPYYSQFTAVPDFARRFRARLHQSSNVTVLTHANAISLEANEGGSGLHEVKVRSFQGRAVSIRAKFFVICCGGIDSARLLLVSDSVEPHGIGNRYDVVGRFFMDHPGVNVGVVPHDARRFRQWYDPFRVAGIKHVLGMRASEKLQREQRVLNLSASVYYPTGTDDAIEAAKRLLHLIRSPSKFSQVPKALASVARQPRRIAVAAYRHYALRQPSSVGGSLPRLGIGGEQAPNRESRITLASEVDSLGMRRSVLDWKLTDEDLRSFETFAAIISAEWRRLGIGEIKLSDLHLAERARGADGGFVDAFHHMGTARMGTNPKTSVVDAQCKVHDYDNLYVASSAVFPTGSFSNPTLTIIALCLRLSDELKHRMTHAVPTITSPAGEEGPSSS